MPKYFLSRDVYLCEVDDAAIVLDLHKQKYFGLPSQCWNELKRILPQLASSGDSAARTPDTAENLLSQCVEFLLEQGILTQLQREGREPSIASVRTESSLLSVERSATRKPLAIHHIWRFLASVTYVAFNLWRSRSALIVRRWQENARAHEVEARDLARARDLVMRFLRMRMWTYTRHNACLLDSYALVEFLRRYGVKPTLVVGVSTKPFQAHAWAQLGSTVLNDILENVHQYTPILAV